MRTTVAKIGGLTCTVSAGKYCLVFDRQLKLIDISDGTPQSVVTEARARAVEAFRYHSLNVVHDHLGNHGNFVFKYT